MVRCFVAAVICSASVSLAGTSWSDAVQSTAMASDPQPAAGLVAATSDVGDVINSIVIAKAGRSVTRISAGLSGDWAATEAMQLTDGTDHPSNENAIPSANLAMTVPPLKWMGSPDFRSDPTEVHAVALPLPPAAMAAIPGLLVAYFAQRRFAKN